jgi:hypothetical protein
MRTAEEGTPRLTVGQYINRFSRFFGADPLMVEPEWRHDVVMSMSFASAFYVSVLGRRSAY